MKKILILFTSVVFMVFSAGLSSQERKIEIGIDEQLGKTVPLDLEFTTSDGKVLKLKDIITKPTVLALVYYRCPGICSPLLGGFTEVVDKTDLTPGKDFQMLTISFNHREDYKLAADKKVNYYAQMKKKKLAEEDWIWMAGDSVSIRTLTDAVGFYYKPDGEDFIHSGTLIVFSPKGKITRYLFGTSYMPFDFKMAVIEASKGMATPTVNKILQFCYSYDPEGKSYVFNITRVIGSAMFILIGTFFLVLILMGRKRKNKKEAENG